MNADPRTWSRDSICLRDSSLDVTSIAAELYHLTCRANFDAPGFGVLSLDHHIDSVTCRQFMVDLKLEMAAIHETASGNALAYLSAGRFDQQLTTRPHLDGGPDECFLMLGYEPSAIDSELRIFDYAKCAFDLGLSPKEFMVRHNPMFRSGYDILLPYCSRISCFSPRDYQIICINNSTAPYSQSKPAWQGNLHTATILTPDESKRRVINSTMIASVPAGTSDAVDTEELNDFISTSVVHCQVSDKVQPKTIN
jgi:hypothetical protein